MPGLVVNSAEMPLDKFRNSPRGPEDNALADFVRVLKAHALVNGNFYTQEGFGTAIDQNDDKPRFAGFAPPTAAEPPGGKTRKSVA